MNKIEIEKKILDEKLIGIIRAGKIDNIQRVVESLLRGGLSILEVSFNTPGAAALIRTIVDEFGSAVCCGAGTVLDEVTAMRAIEAGSKFVISPIFNKGMIKICLAYGVAPIPGVFTPTEAADAYKEGASFLKLFPSHILGPEFIKAVKTVLPQLPFIPVGGVSLDNVEAFLKAGASAIAIGGAIINDSLIRDAQYTKIEQNAKIFRERIDSCLIK